MYCPNCAAEVDTGATQCQSCGASFGAEAAWKPSAQAPSQAHSVQRYDTRPTSQRLAFSGKVLAFFILIGPLIGLLGTGESVGGNKVLFALPFVYLIGGAFALTTWILFSASFAFIALVESRGSLPKACFSPVALAVVAGLVGGTSGYVVWTTLGCSASGWVHGGWVPCLRVSVWRDYGISILPGFACGLFSVLLWHKREA
jgi:hypothetical protein